MSQRPLFLSDDMPHGSLNGHASRKVDVYAEKPHDLRCQKHLDTIDGGFAADNCPACQREQVEDTAAKTSYRFAPINSAAFAAGNYRPSWLVKQLLVQGQPAVIGGPRKALKTSLLVDLAISLSTATDFLGVFSVPQPRRVALLSGESGEFTLHETAERVCAAKGIELAKTNVEWDFRLPQLSSAIQLDELCRGIEKLKVEIVIIDPLYLCLLSGNPQAQASNLFDIGPLLMGITQACKNVGAVPVFSHHARKNLSNAFEPLELEDLSFAGIQEFARQWMLINRREKYVPGTGEHRLWFSAGGSVGHGGLWALDITEGVIDDNFRGRYWDVSVMTHGESIEVKKQTASEKKTYAQIERDKSEDARLLVALDALDTERQGVSYTAVRTEARLNNDTMDRAIRRLAKEGIIEELQVEIAIGKNGKRKAKGIKRAIIGIIGTDHQD